MKMKLKLLQTLITGSIILITIMFSACTRKKNLTGINWSDVRPLTVRDTLFTLGFSYQHSGKVSGAETSLICGISDGKEAIAVFRFTGMPETMTVSGQPVLKLVATRRSDLQANPLILSLHKLNANWKPDSTANIEDSQIQPLNISFSDVPDSVSAAGDTLSINIPTDVIQNWKEEDVTGFNLVLKIESGGWLELKSVETLNGPQLVFNYQLPNDTTVKEFKQRAVTDSYRVTGTQTETVPDIWQLKNLLPQRVFVKFGLPDGIFKDMDGTTLSEPDRRRMTINKAELVLFVKDNPYYQNTRLSLYPHNVSKDSVNAAMVFTDDDLESNIQNPTTNLQAVSDSVLVDVTALIQGFTSGDKSNKGIVIRFLQEMKNYGILEFWHFLNAPTDKKPYLRITYTPPYL